MNYIKKKYQSYVLRKIHVSPTSIPSVLMLFGFGVPVWGPAASLCTTTLSYNECAPLADLALCMITPYTPASETGGSRRIRTGTPERRPKQKPAYPAWVLGVGGGILESETLERGLTTLTGKRGIVLRTIGSNLGAWRLLPGEKNASVHPLPLCPIS